MAIHMFDIDFSDHRNLNKLPQIGCGDGDEYGNGYGDEFGNGYSAGCNFDFYSEMMSGRDFNLD